MFIRKKFHVLYLAAVVLLMFAFSTRLSAQNVTLLARFSTVNGTVEFLPGAWVNVWNNGRSKYYKYEDGKFAHASELPKILRKWKSFSWRSVDYLDQIARQDYDTDINEFLPKHRRVKKVVNIPLRSRGQELVLVCFTLKSTSQFALPGGTDIYMTVLLAREGASTSTYTKLWTRKMETDASYGEFTFQEVPNVGRFLLLYWADMGGSGGQDALDVYRITD